MREKSTLKARASLPIKEATWRERRSSVRSLTITLSRILSRRSILQHYPTSHSSPQPWSLDVQSLPEKSSVRRSSQLSQQCSSIIARSGTNNLNRFLSLKFTCFHHLSYLQTLIAVALLKYFVIFQHLHYEVSISHVTLVRVCFILPRKVRFSYCFQFLSVFLSGVVDLKLQLSQSNFRA